MSLVPGQILSTYEILGPLGAGGMGDVYRARDTRLEREVALKVLAPKAGAQPGQVERFRREARILASLDHPNVVHVHSVEEADGLHFLTMGLVAGRSLRTHIPGEGMPADELLPLARSIAAGVAAAHALGIVHRDLKPANIMITEAGQVKILDFGLAKHAEPAQGSLELTGVGTAVGTVPYMSPEQLRGIEIDARSDIFSFGVVLFEMGTGQRPFVGDSAVEVIAAVLNDEPPPFRGPCSVDVPGLEGMVARCLEKDPERRYANMGALIQDLAGLESGGQTSITSRAGLGPARPSSGFPESARPSLAVLPFVNMSGDPEQDHLAQGLWFDLYAELVKYAGLFLLNGTSTATYAGREVDPREVGRELGVRHVLEGAVRRAGDRVRITIRLTDTATGQPVWADRLEGGMDDLFALQDDINARILDALGVQLLYGEGGRIMRSSLKNPKARDILYRAIPLSFSSKPEELKQARALLDEVERMEPGHTHTYAHMGWAYYFEAASGWCTDTETAFARAEGFATKAIEVGDPTGMAYMLMATIHLSRREHDRAREAGQAALERRPGCPWAYAVLGNIHNFIGEPHRAIELASRAIRLSPLVPDLFPAVMATGYYLIDEPAKAIAAAQNAIDLDGDNLDAHVVLAAALVAAGRSAETSGVVSEIHRIRPGFTPESLAQRLPFRDPERLESLVADLHRAEL